MSERAKQPEKKQPVIGSIRHLGRCAGQLASMYVMNEIVPGLRAKVEVFDPTDCFGEDSPEDQAIRSGRWA